jgi:nicotinate dehydrogenase subunit A
MPVFDLLVNGVRARVETQPGDSLLSVLRDDVGLTGTKYGCGEGQCGACTVLIDEQAVRSCVTRVAAAAGKRITTIEGLERDGRLHPVQESFIREGAMQCGYCTTGMIMSAVGLLRQHPNPTSEQIVRAMDRNVCRCGTYSRIVAAIRRAAEGGTSDEAKP